MTGAELVVEALQGAGVRHLFTVSGNQNLPIFDACIGSKLVLIHTRHEAAAVHMADGWGRLTDSPGVALLTAGPGHCNGLTGLMVAQAAESPLLLISGHSPLSQFGSGAFQEVDQVAMAAPVAKHSGLVSKPHRLAVEVAESLRLAVSNRPGPVHLSVPIDVLQADVESANERNITSDAVNDATPLKASEVEDLLDRLQAAERPLILAGPALSRGTSWSTVCNLGEVVSIPVLPCESPRGIDDPWLRGAKKCLGDADLILLIGKRLDFSLRFGVEPFASSAVFISVDAEVPKNSERLDTCLRTDPATCAHRLLEAASGRTWQPTEWVTEFESARSVPASWLSHRNSTESPIHPLAVSEALQPFLENDAVFVSDGGEIGQWMQASLTAEIRLINGPSGSIGSSLPMGMAAKLLYPERNVFVFLGDGTFGFHALEIDTCVRYGIPVLVIVGNDARWNAEAQLQIRNYGADRTIGCELLPTRYDRVAEALGGHGEHVSNPHELAPAVERALASGLPSVIDVQIDGVAAPTF